MVTSAGAVWYSARHSRPFSTTAPAAKEIEDTSVTARATRTPSMMPDSVVLWVDPIWMTAGSPAAAVVAADRASGVESA